MRAARGGRLSRVRGRATPTSPASPNTAASDVRDVLERASARETTARVAAGGVARQLLARAGITYYQPRVRDRRCPDWPTRTECRSRRRPRLADDAPVRCVDAETRTPDDRRDRSRARSWRYAGRRVRGHRHRHAGRPWQLRAVGSQARRPPCPGADVDSGDQGGGHRPRAGSRSPTRIARARRDRPRAVVDARSPGSPGRPTTPAASRAASPTARTFACPRG